MIALESQVTCGQEMRSRTNVHYLVFHLTLADTITSYVTLPMETLWRQGQIFFPDFLLICQARVQVLIPLSKVQVPNPDP